MQNRATMQELVAAVRLFVEQELAPSQQDDRVRFRTRVAINALTSVERELAQGDEALRHEVADLATLLDRHVEVPEDPASVARCALELNLELARRIRAGEAPPGTLGHLERIGAAKLRVASPRYLQRYEIECPASDPHGRGE